MSRAHGQDFKGQLWCERVFQVMIAAFGIVGFIIGYIQQARGARARATLERMRSMPLDLAARAHAALNARTVAALLTRLPRFAGLQIHIPEPGDGRRDRGGDLPARLAVVEPPPDQLAAG